MATFREMVNQHLEQGVVRPSKSPNASPAFLVPKNEGGGVPFSGRLPQSELQGCFDTYPMPTIDQALKQFGAAVMFSVLDLNSAYYQIPLSVKSRRITAFCTPFGLFEFNKLPMGISVGCQGLSRVVDELFADLKGGSCLTIWTTQKSTLPPLRRARSTCGKFCANFKGLGSL
jgi:hypothetical protein